MISLFSFIVITVKYSQWPKWSSIMFFLDGSAIFIFSPFNLIYQNSVLTIFYTNKWHMSINAVHEILRLQCIKKYDKIRKVQLRRAVCFQKKNQHKQFIRKILFID